MILFIHFKIARLDACTFVELQYKLNFDASNDNAALSTSENAQGKINFLYFKLNFSHHLF